jgi:hypothetical protein
MFAHQCLRVDEVLPVEGFECLLFHRRSNVLRSGSGTTDDERREIRGAERTVRKRRERREGGETIYGTPS